MKSFILAALTVLSLGIGAANAATSSQRNQHNDQKNEMLGGQGG